MTTQPQPTLLSGSIPMTKTQATNLVSSITSPGDQPSGLTQGEEETLSAYYELFSPTKDSETLRSYLVNAGWVIDLASVYMPSMANANTNRRYDWLAWKETGSKTELCAGTYKHPILIISAYDVDTSFEITINGNRAGRWFSFTCYLIRYEQAPQQLRGAEDDLIRIWNSLPTMLEKT